MTNEEKAILCSQCKDRQLVRQEVRETLIRVREEADNFSSNYYFKSGIIVAIDKIKAYLELDDID